MHRRDGQELNEQEPQVPWVRPVQTDEAAQAQQDEVRKAARELREQPDEQVREAEEVCS